MMSTERPGTIFAAAVIGAALVICAMIGAATVLHVKNNEQTIEVKGSARKRIKSDLAVWRTSVTCQGSKLATAYHTLNTSVPRVKAYLVAKGIAENQITMSAPVFLDTELC